MHHQESQGLGSNPSFKKTPSWEQQQELSFLITALKFSSWRGLAAVGQDTKTGIIFWTSIQGFILKTSLSAYNRVPRTTIRTSSIPCLPGDWLLLFFYLRQTNLCSTPSRPIPSAKELNNIWAFSERKSGFTTSAIDFWRQEEGTSDNTSIIPTTIVVRSENIWLMEERKE